MKKIFTLCFLIIFSSCKQQGVDAAIAELPAGSYKVDKTHASLIFRVNHLGLSNYTARFKRFDAELDFDVLNPVKAKVVATIDPTSLETDFPEKKPDFNAMLQKPQWLDVVKFPKIIFRSQKVELTGKNTARVVGELELHGIKKEVVMNVKFNGGYASHDFDPSGSRIGFSAVGVLKRSDFGIIFGIPEKGSKMGVGDEVEFVIEAEFTRPLEKKAGK